MKEFFNGVKSWKQRIKELNIMKSVLKKYSSALDWKDRHYVTSLISIIDWELGDISLQIENYQKKLKEQEEKNKQMKLDI